MIRSLCLAVLFAVPVLAIAQQPVPVVQKGKTAAVKVNQFRIVGTTGEPTCWIRLLNTSTRQWDVLPVVNGCLPVTYYRDGVTIYDYSVRYPYSGGNEEVTVEVPFKETTPNGVKRPDVPKNDGGKTIPDTPKIKPVVLPEAPAPKEVVAPKIMPKVIEGPKRDK